MHRKNKFIILIFISLLSVFNSTPFFATQNSQLERPMKVDMVQPMNTDGLPPGKYRIVLRFEKDGVVVEKIINFIIKEDASSENRYKITGEDISVPVELIGKLTDDDWLNRINARIVNITTAEEAEITFIDTSEIKPEVGNYSLFFGNRYIGTSIIVNVIANPEKDENKNEIYERNNQTVIWKNENDESNYFVMNFEFLVLLSTSIFIIVLFVFPLLLFLWEYRMLRRLFNEVRTFFVEK